jgi:hypothetical protein
MTNYIEKYFTKEELPSEYSEYYDNTNNKFLKIKGLIINEKKEGEWIVCKFKKINYQGRRKNYVYFYKKINYINNIKEGECLIYILPHYTPNNFNEYILYKQCHYKNNKLDGNYIEYNITPSYTFFINNNFIKEKGLMINGKREGEWIRCFMYFHFYNYGIENIYINIYKINYINNLKEGKCELYNNLLRNYNVDVDVDVNMNIKNYEVNKTFFFKDNKEINGNNIYYISNNDKIFCSANNDFDNNNNWYGDSDNDNDSDDDYY